MLGIYCFKETEGIKQLGELIALGRENSEPERLTLSRLVLKRMILPQLYIHQATTGLHPKRSIVSHANIISNFMAVKEIRPIGEGRLRLELPASLPYL